MSKVRELRMRKNITQSQLADECNVSQAAISAIECQIHNPSLALAKKIAQALACSVDDLFP